MDGYECFYYYSITMSHPYVGWLIRETYKKRNYDIFINIQNSKQIDIRLLTLPNVSQCHFLIKAMSM